MLINIRELTLRQLQQLKNIPPDEALDELREEMEEWKQKEMDREGY